MLELNIEMHYHFIREKVLQEEIQLKHVKTEDQVADLFMKSLSRNKFERFLHQLGIVEGTEAGTEAGIEGGC